MRAAVFTEKGVLEVREVPRPAAGSREILLRTAACGLCGSDMYKIRNRTVPPGAILGHEVSAVVVSSPPEYASCFPPGARVTVSNHIPCNACGACRKGRISMCSHFQSTCLDPGGFAEFIRVPESHIPQGVLPLPDDLSDEAAVSVEPMGCCLRALERWRPRRGESILVVGLGPIGLLMVLLLRWMGAVALGVDPIACRREFASYKGCDRVLLPGEIHTMDPVQGVVLTACNPFTLEMAIQQVEPGGWIGLFAGPPHDIPVPCGLQALYRKEIEMIPSYSTGPDHMREAIKLLEEKEIDLEGLISHRFAIHEIQRAVELAESQQGLKAMLFF